MLPICGNRESAPGVLGSWRGRTDQIFLYCDPNPQKSKRGRCTGHEKWYLMPLPVVIGTVGIPGCRDSHSGERQADLIMSILETFGIMSKLGYHTGDNATSNNTCLESIARRLKE